MEDGIIEHALSLVKSVRKFDPGAYKLAKNMIENYNYHYVLTEAVKLAQNEGSYEITNTHIDRALLDIHYAAMVNHDKRSMTKIATDHSMLEDSDITNQFNLADDEADNRDLGSSRET